MPTGSPVLAAARRLGRDGFFSAAMSLSLRFGGALGDRGRVQLDRRASLGAMSHEHDGLSRDADPSRTNDVALRPRSVQELHPESLGPDRRETKLELLI